MKQGHRAAARAVALAGPYGSGKTTLLDALLLATGARDRMPQAGGSDRTGDSGPEARARGLSTDMSIAGFEYLGDRYWALDLPGSPEFCGDTLTSLDVADVAVVVVEPDPAKAVAAQPWLIELSERGVPHMIFVNKIETSAARVREIYDALAEISPRPLVMRQIPIRDGDAVTGYIDLALERAYVYRDGDASKEVPIPSALADQEADARFEMLERLADYDDALMELLLEDQAPERDVVCADLARELREGLITPVFLGSAAQCGGVRRLLKALRHEAPSVSVAAERAVGSETLGEAAATVRLIKTSHAGQAGKISYGRVLSGEVADGAAFARANGESARCGGLFAPHGGDMTKQAAAGPGDMIAMARLGEAEAGELLVLGGPGAAPPRRFDAPRPVMRRALAAGDKKGEVKLTAALAKLAEEDPCLSTGPDAETGELHFAGLGEVHLAVALEKLKRKFGVDAVARPVATPYRETIRKATTERGRHKKQSGGHGQFGDVVLEVAPLARGEGFEFDVRISGGVVPRQYFSAVEHGVRDAMARGPLGFPVTDVAVTLVDGSHHAVDSSEIAFRTAGRIGMAAALEHCAPILLEPILKVVAYAPSECMSRVTSILSSRRGQILGFDAREGWPGWDRIEAYLPQAEVGDLIIELRSATQGLATFEAELDHAAELSGRLAAAVVEARTQTV